MSDWYHKVGTTYRDAFTYAVTGLTDSDFTKLLTKDGSNVAAPAGITITNVSSTVRYDVAVDASSGFVSAAGAYHLVIYRTSIPSDRWESVIVVTNDGTGAGTLGTASFTAISGNGRVTDGSSPLQYATVYIRRSNGNLYASLTSSATGLWGPVYFDVDGTYSVTVQRSGYSVGTGTITVSAWSATGPGADIALTALSAASSLTASSLWAYARRMYVSRQGTQADAEIKQAVNSALWQVASERDWPWLYTMGRVNFEAAYTTGTVTVTDGSAVVTLSGGTFPTWAASGEIFIAGQWHGVASRDSGTQLTLDNVWNGADTDGSGLAYTLAQYEYDLPTDCRTVVKIVNQNAWLWGPEPVSRWAIELAKQQYGASGAIPAGSYLHAIEKNRLVVWPYPGAEMMVNLLYVKRPAALTAAPDTADWDDLQLEVLHRAIDFQVACLGQCVAGDRKQTFDAYKEALARAVPNDRSSRPRHAGWRGSGDGLPRNYTITG